MRRLGVLIGAMALAGCASTAPPTACPAGQASMRTAQLFLGGKGQAAPSEPELRRFVVDEVTPRFPDGVTLTPGGGRWKGPEHQMMRDAAKVLVLVLPAKGDPAANVEAVRAAYRARFNQDSAVVMPPPVCVAL